MTDIPNELVETGALAIQRVTSFGHYEATDAAMAALLAVGLPALLERVEAAEGEVERLRKGMLEVPPKIATVMGDEVTKLRAELAAVRTLHTDKIIAFDALAAKVADYEATPTNLREHLSATIRWRLVAANMSQADVAAFVGVSQKHLSQILNGRRDGSLSMWQRLLDFVNTDARTALDASETPRWAR